MGSLCATAVSKTFFKKKKKLNYCERNKSLVLCSVSMKSSIIFTVNFIYFFILDGVEKAKTPAMFHISLERFPFTSSPADSTGSKKSFFFLFL